MPAEHSAAAEPRADVFARPSAFVVAVAVSIPLALAVTLPAVWWQPLHEDETVTLDIAPRSFGYIVDLVFANKGGAPAHFFLEHLFLAWPGGVEGLRLPSLAFFLLALPAAGLVGVRIAGRVPGLLLVPALALAPLAVNLATFGRMYGMFLAATLWAFLLALVAAEDGRPVLWALAGAALGTLVYVHPVAPLYIGVALLAALVHAGESLRGLIRTAWPAPLALLAVGLPFYLYSLPTLRDRYGVYRGQPRLDTGQGESVPRASLEGLMPGGTAATIAFTLLGVVGIAWLARARPRSAVIVGLWLVVPITYFALIPVGNTRFFDRYLLPALPLALLAVLTGAVSLARSRRLGRAGLACAVVAAWRSSPSRPTRTSIASGGCTTPTSPTSRPPFPSTGTGCSSPRRAARSEAGRRSTWTGTRSWRPPACSGSRVGARSWRRSWPETIDRALESGSSAGRRNPWRQDGSGSPTIPPCARWRRARGSPWSRRGSRRARASS